MNSSLPLRPIGFALVGAALFALCVGFFRDPGVGKLNYRLTVKPTVMTVAYKAYGNPQAADGKYWLARLTLENQGEGPLSDVSVSYRIPEYLDWSTPRSIATVLKGQTRVLPIYPKLPTKVTNLRSRTPSSLEIKLAWKDGKETHEKIEVREFEFRGVTEVEYTSLPADEMLTWADMYDNAEICAAFVTDEDPVVRQYLGEISETMGGIPICSNAEELSKVMRSIYNYQVGTGMKYTGNKGVPERLGDAKSTVQSVRLPRDVIYQNSGLCIELAMLWAALGQGSSAKVYLALVPGHCYPVLEANDGTILPIEATGIGGSNVGGTMTFEQAVETGTKEFQALMRGETPGVLIDVILHQGRGVRPPEFEAVALADLARLLDERTAKALAGAGGGGGGGGGGATPERPGEPTPGPDNQDLAGNWQWYQVPGLNARVPYPKTYTANPSALANISGFFPSIQLIAYDPSGQNSVEVYAASGTRGQDLIQSSLYLAQQIGANIQYDQPLQVSIGGQQGSLHPYTIQVPGQTLYGGFYIYETNQGLFAFTVGGTQRNWRTLGDQIAAAVRFGN